MARYFRRGYSKIRWLPAVANGTSPSRAEITAGTDLSPSIAEVGGFRFTNSPIATPDFASRFTTTIPGEDTVETPTLTFYDDDTVTTLRTLLAYGAAGYIYLMPYGDTPTKRAELWRVRSTGPSDEWTAGNDAARWSTQFAVEAAPNTAAVIPA